MHTRLAHPRPWQFSVGIDGYVLVSTLHEPVVQVCLVPVNGSPITAEHTAALIVQWSQRDAAGAP